MKINKYFVVIMCLVFIFCAVSVVGKIFTLTELPINFMAAFLGAIVTAVITLFLLNGQSKAEEEKNKNIKVFEKKSLLFEDFNSKLLDIVMNQKISASDYIELKSVYYSKLMLYLQEKSQVEIMNYLVNLGECVGISINDVRADLDTVNNLHERIKENVYNIINVLTAEIGMSGKIDTSLQNELDNKVFPSLFSELLLEEFDKIFSKEKIFNKAFYQVVADGTFLVLYLNGKMTVGGGIHIGPFYNYHANESFSVSDGIYFRFFAPMNPVSELYTVNDGTNYSKLLIDFEKSEKGLINLQDRLLPWELQMINIAPNVYNKKLQAIKFDDIDTIKNYSGFYIEIVKAIAARSYHYFLNAKTRKDSLTIKELYEKFERVPLNQYTEYMLKLVTTSVDFSK